MNLTCRLYSTYNTLKTNADYNNLTTLLQFTLIDGCRHVSSSSSRYCYHTMHILQMRSMFGEQPTVLSEGSGLEVDDCSQLQYLNRLCAPVLIKSVEETTRLILEPYRGGEGFVTCQWLQSNNILFRNLFNC